MGALDGLVVLDLGRRYPATYTAMFFADFGADVIKIDPPPGPVRIQRPGTSEDRFAAFFPADRSKRSIILDLKIPAARDVLGKLVERADVLVEGFRPGVMDRLGVGYSRLSAINPRLVYCALSGYGQTGPYARMAGHDMNYIALAGVLSLIGERDGQPYLPSNLVADYGGGGLHGTIGILLALMARERTGRGQFVDVGYVDAVISLLTSHASQYFASGKVPKRGEPGMAGGQVFRCKDGEYFTIATAAEQNWANLCRALGREHLIRWQPDNLEESDRVNAELAAIFLTRTRDEWWQYLKDKECCAGPVLNVDEAFRDPQVLHRKMLLEMKHPEHGAIRQAGIPIKLSGTPGEVRHLGVAVGTDTEQVLAQAGYSAAEIADLRAGGVLG